MTIIVPRKRHRRPPKKNQTGNLVGIILILVAIAIIAVVLHFTLNMKSPAQSVQGPAAGNSQASNGTENATPQADPDVIFPSRAAVQGKWAMSVGVAKSEMTIVGDMFQIIAIQDEKGEVRRYTRGFYDYDEKTGKLTLKPDDRTGEPDAINGVIYKMMTSRPFDVYVSKKKMAKEMFWAPPQDMIESRQIHPLFYYIVTEGPLVLTWVKIADVSPVTTKKP